jgi:surface antigen/regulator of replication initiation timing
MQRSTTVKNKKPLSTHIGRGLIFASALIMAVATPIQMSQNAAADKYDDQIAALQAQIDSANAQVSNLKSQANTYATAAAGLQAQVTAIQDQIAISTAKYNQLTQQIADTEQKIKDNQDALGQTLADLYVDGNVSPIEMLASSKNISDYLDKQELQSSIRDQLTSTIKEIQDLKDQLVKKQSDAKATLVNQQASHDALAAAQQQQQDLYNQTQGQEAAYQSLIAANQSKQKDLAAQQLAAMAATINSTGGAKVLKSGVAGGYPWNSGNCPMSGFYSTGGVDGNGSDGYGYGCRQCASYAAWRMAKETGFYPVNWGNAINFPSRGRAAGYAVDGTPSAGSMAVMSTSQAGTPYGHVAWVDAVEDNGKIIVSQYNYYYNGWGNYTQMELSASAFTWFIHVS